jgi:hypothetical protein
MSLPHIHRVLLAARVARLRSGDASILAEFVAAEGGALKTKEKIVSASNASTAAFVSAGERFPDGAMIELVSGSFQLDKPNLLLWSECNANVGPCVEHGGRAYEAPELDPILWRAMRLPAGCCDYGSARALFDGIRDLFQRHLGVPESESELLACFAISTWLADRLPTAPNLTISGPDEELGIDVLRLLSCICRHPLMLAELTPGSFRSLPMQLSLTLLLDQQRLRPNLQRILRASGYRGMYWPGNRGRVVDLYGPKAIFCGSNSGDDTLGGGVIHISMAPSQLQPSALDDRIEDEIATHFQPRLLMYRLKNSSKVRESEVNVSQFSFATRRLAYALAACFPEDLELARDAVQALQPQDEEIRERRFHDVNCAIIEILLAWIHRRDQRELAVEELAKLVNALLRSRGETRQYSAEEVGWKLNRLNIVRHTSSSGRQVKFGRDTSLTVHRLVAAYDWPRSENVEVSCLDCAQQINSN